MSGLQQRSRSTFLKCALHAQASFSRCKRAISAVVRRRSVPALWAPAPRRRLRPAHAIPQAQHGIAQAKFLGHRPTMSDRSKPPDRPLAAYSRRKRPTLTFFHQHSCSSSLLQVSINSEEVQCADFVLAITLNEHQIQGFNQPALFLYVPAYLLMQPTTTRLSVQRTEQQFRAVCSGATVSLSLRRHGSMRCAPEPPSASRPSGYDPRQECAARSGCLHDAR